MHILLVAEIILAGEAFAELLGNGQHVTTLVVNYDRLLTRMRIRLGGGFYCCSSAVGSVLGGVDGFELPGE